ncbi:MAG: protein of unknown function with transrane region [Parcubacteria group bacterium]|nr:protein of unknown function with transrane region [Parcubacteria group bacterium]
MIKKITPSLIIAISLLGIATPVFADPVPSGATPATPSGATPATPSGATPLTPSGATPADNSDGKGLVNPLKNISSLDGLLSAVLNAIVTVLAPIFLTLAFIYVGFLFVMARGNAEKISSARSALVWTVIGALILLGANAIGLVIKSTVSGL